MEFQENMEDEVLPNVNVEQIIQEISSETDNCTTEESATKAVSMDASSEQMSNSEDTVTAKFEAPSATSSKSKHMSVTSETKTKGIQEFVRILRPHLPRKSKSRAYKLLQNIARGIIVESTFERRIRQKKPKKRTLRKSKALSGNEKSLSSLKVSARSLYGSSDSCRSDGSCPRCGYTCCRVGRF